MTNNDFYQWLGNRIAVLDGAMGTMIQQYGLSERDFHCCLTENHPVPLAGNNDLLVLSRQDVIESIHREYVKAGADIITTDTFNAQRVSQADYRTGHLVGEINRRAACIARQVADEDETRRVLVAGSVGPTNRTASMSPDVADPTARNIGFDELVDAYTEQMEALKEGGVDLLLIETVFDTLNLKAALTAALPTGLPVMVSVTIADNAGRTLTGQTLEAFVVTVSQWPNVVSIGLNCSFGPEAIRPYVEIMDELSPVAVSVHPNAGLPDECGCYLQTPDRFAAALTPIITGRHVNIAGGCCGTTPSHIAALSAMAVGKPPRHISHERASMLQLAGLERLIVKPGYTFVNIGERCNVAGSRKFLRLIKEKNTGEAVEIARRQVEDGAMVIDINMDDAMLDAPAEMVHFLRALVSDPDVSRVPFMIDSSRTDVIIEALKQIPGRAIVNSISLKEGEEAFINIAQKIRAAGAAVVVMAFDERGQADTAARKIEIASRCYRLLTDVVGFAPCDIIFDPGIMSIATGLDEHDNYAVDFIEAVKWIKTNLPGAYTSGGVSNLSFALRGHNRLREAMHAVFLYHAVAAGLDMAILNPATTVTYEDIDERLRELLTDVILNRRRGARDELIALTSNDHGELSAESGRTADAWRLSGLNDRLRMALVKGVDGWLKEDLEEALASGMAPVDIIEGPLMDGMNHVGKLFGEGKMFLPQVVKTARTMKRAVDILRPVMDSQRSKTGVKTAGKVIIATVKGDVHDIGKNIVGIVLACNNFEVIDMGVMVSAEDIVRRVIEEKPIMVGLSGLITPSLGEMVKVAEALERAGDRTPLVVGGATTSLLHTALKIAPVRSSAVIHAADASRDPIIAALLADDSSRETFIAENYERQAAAVRRYKQAGLHPQVSLEEGRRQAVRPTEPAPTPLCPGIHHFVNVKVTDIVPYINWRMFFHAWRVTGGFLDGFPYDLCDGCVARWESSLKDSDIEKAHNALSLYRDARHLIDRLIADDIPLVSATVALLHARADGDDIVIDERLRLPMLRSLTGDVSRSLSDYFTENGSDYVGVFAVRVDENAGCEGHSEYDYDKLLFTTVSHRLAEAASEWLHLKTRRELWGYAPDERLTVRELFHGDFIGIRPAVGYPSMPDQTIASELLLMLPDSGINVSSTGALSPAASELGLYIARPEARYFDITTLTPEQIEDYASRRGTSMSVVRSTLSRLCH